MNQQNLKELVVKVSKKDLMEWVVHRVKEMYNLPPKDLLDVSFEKQADKRLAYKIVNASLSKEQVYIVDDFYLNSHYWILRDVVGVGYLLDAKFEISDIEINTVSKSESWIIRYVLQGDISKVYLTDEMSPHRSAFIESNSAIRICHD